MLLNIGDQMSKEVIRLKNKISALSESCVSEMPIKEKLHLDKSSYKQGFGFTKDWTGS